MKFVRAIWKLLVGIKDALVLIFMLLFFAGLYGVLSAKPPAVGQGVLDLDLSGTVVEQQYGQHDGDAAHGASIVSAGSGAVQRWFILRRKMLRRSPNARSAAQREVVAMEHTGRT